MPQEPGLTRAFIEAPSGRIPQHHPINNSSDQEMTARLARHLAECIRPILAAAGTFELDDPGPVHVGYRLLHSRPVISGHRWQNPPELIVTIYPPAFHGRTLAVRRYRSQIAQSVIRAINAFYFINSGDLARPCILLIVEDNGNSGCLLTGAGINEYECGHTDI